MAVSNEVARDIVVALIQSGDYKATKDGSKIREPEDWGRVYQEVLASVKAADGSSVSARSL